MNRRRTPPPSAARTPDDPAGQPTADCLRIGLPTPTILLGWPTQDRHRTGGGRGRRLVSVCRLSRHRELIDVYAGAIAGSFSKAGSNCNIFVAFSQPCSRLLQDCHFSNELVHGHRPACRFAKGFLVACRFCGGLARGLHCRRLGPRPSCPCRPPDADSRPLEMRVSRPMSPVLYPVSPRGRRPHLGDRSVAAAFSPARSATGGAT
jgi:hypothetical protein